MQFKDVFKDWGGKEKLSTLRTFPYASDIHEMTLKEVHEQPP